MRKIFFASKQIFFWHFLCFMQIFWQGQSCFQINTTPGKNNQINIVIDPFDESVGFKVPNLQADIVLITHNHPDHNNAKAVKGPGGQAPFLISNPGEYEIREVYVQGIPAWHDEVLGKERGPVTIYTIDTEDLRVCHLGDLGQKELTDEQLEKIGEVDILMIPVGGVYTITASDAVKIIAQIEPRIVIPMHYAIPGLKVKLDGVDKFLKEMGVKSVEPQQKLLIKKKDLPQEETKVMLLKP